MRNIEDAMKFDHGQKHFINETATRLIYSRVARPGDVVIDCGANLGDHTRVLSALVGPSGMVHAFEPNPKLFSGILGIGDNVRLWPFAVGEDTRVETLHVPEGLSGWASLEDISKLVPDRRMTLVSTVQADMNSLVEIPDDVRFVKIDVERREYQVLKGMTRIIGGGRPVIILENLTPEISEYFRKFEYTVVNVVGTPIVGAPAFPNVLAYPNAMDPIRLTEAELDALVSQAEALTPRAED